VTKFEIAFSTAYAPVSSREPFSDVPYDFLLLLLIVPAHVAILRLDKVFTAALTTYWHGAAARLRLSSYMKGVRFPEQEHGGSFERGVLKVANFIHSIFRWFRKDTLEWNVFKGGYMRVPYA
jgi:hypothetical protein